MTALQPESEQGSVLPRAGRSRSRRRLQEVRRVGRRGAARPAVRTQCPGQLSPSRPRPLSSASSSGQLSPSHKSKATSVAAHAHAHRRHAHMHRRHAHMHRRHALSALDPQHLAALTALSAARAAAGEQPPTRTRPPQRHDQPRDTGARIAPCLLSTETGERPGSRAEARCRSLPKASKPGRVLLKARSSERAPSECPVPVSAQGPGRKGRHRQPPASSTTARPAPRPRRRQHTSPASAPRPRTRAASLARNAAPPVAAPPPRPAHWSTCPVAPARPAHGSPSAPPVPPPRPCRQSHRSQCRPRPRGVPIRGRGSPTRRLHTCLPLAVCACPCHSVSVAPPRQLIHGYVKPQPPRITPPRIAVASPRPCGAAPHAALRSPRHTHHGTWAAAGPEAWTEASIRALNAPSSRRPPPSPPTASSATPGPMPTKTTPTTRVSPPPPDQASRPSVLGYRLTSAGAAQVHPPGPCRPLPPPSRARPVGPGPEKAEVSCGRAGAADGA